MRRVLRHASLKCAHLVMDQLTQSAARRVQGVCTMTELSRSARNALMGRPARMESDASVKSVIQVRDDCMLCPHVFQTRGETDQ
jgi:hypothetical protein